MRICEKKIKETKFDLFTKILYRRLLYQVLGWGFGGGSTTAQSMYGVFCMCCLLLFTYIFMYSCTSTLLCVHMWWCALLSFVLCLLVDGLSVSVVVVHHRFACTTCPNSPANVGRFSWRWAKSNPPSFCAVPCLLGCGVWGCAARLYLLFFSLCSYVS